MAEKEKKLRIIKQDADVTLYADTIEMNDGSKRDFIILAHKKRSDFVKNEKGQIMYNVTWESREWLPAELLKNCKEVFK